MTTATTQPVEAEALRLLDEATRALQRVNSLGLEHDFRIARFEAQALEDTPLQMVCDVAPEALHSPRLKTSRPDAWLRSS